MAGKGMRAIAIFVKGGVAWVLGANEPTYVRLEDADNGEVTVYLADGAEVYEVEEEEVQFQVEEALKEVIGGTDDNVPIGDRVSDAG